MAEGVPERLQEAVPEDLDEGPERTTVDEEPAAEPAAPEAPGGEEDTGEDEDLGSGDEPEGGEA